MDLTEEELKPLYMWIDQIPLSRPKRNIARDFSDGGARASRPANPARERPAASAPPV
jgi:hypothetical protein